MGTEQPNPEVLWGVLKSTLTALLVTSRRLFWRHQTSFFGLGVEGATLKPLVLALAHDPLHVLLGDLQIPQQHPLKLAAPLRVGGRLPEELER
jgi:hypothetical protein